MWTKVEKELSAWHRAARECWLRWNIPSAQSLSQDCYTEDLGCYTNGDRGTLGTALERRLTSSAVSLYVIGADAPHQMWLASAAGCWNFVFQFRRPAYCIFYQTWRAITTWVNRRGLPREVGRELFMAIFLSSILLTKLRAQCDLMLTCSDASENATGAVAAAGLTTYGVTTTLSLPTQLPPARLEGVVLLLFF